MSSGPAPKPRKEGSNTAKRVCYVIRQRPNPTGFELTVEDLTGHLLFLVRPRPTELSRYNVSPFGEDEGKPLIVKRTRIGQAVRYALLDGELERLSLLQAFPSTSFLLRDAGRRTIARFIALGPNTMVLRTPVATLARLRFTDRDAPVGLRVDCDAQVQPEWLLAAMLFTIAVVEQASPLGPILKPMGTIPDRQAASQP